MGRAVNSEHVTFTLATGTATTRDTEGANPTIPGELHGGGGLRVGAPAGAPGVGGGGFAGKLIQMVSLESAAGDPPVLATLHLVHESGEVLPLKSGWVRGPSTGGSAGALTFIGMEPIGTNSGLFPLVRNDSGSTVTLTLRWNVAK